MKVFKSLPFRLLLAIMLGMLLGLVLPREAMVVVVHERRSGKCVCPKRRHRSAARRAEETDVARLR